MYLNFVSDQNSLYIIKNISNIMHCQELIYYFYLKAELDRLSWFDFYNSKIDTLISN